MLLITLTCDDCPMEPATCWYDEGDDPLAVGMLAGVAERHRAAYPDHALTTRSESVRDVAERLTAETDAERAAAERAAEDIRRRSAEIAAGHRTGRSRRRGAPAPIIVGGPS